MLLKQKVRKKFLLQRKNKYFKIKSILFKPLIDLIKRKSKKKISLYYPSNYEFDTIELFKILEKKKIYQLHYPLYLQKIRLNL